MIVGDFVRVNEDECSLCGLSSSPLTGEHKIKASLLRAEFGKKHATLAGKNSPKILQSPRSKHVHFKRKICQHCNSTKTQLGDRAFDQLQTQLIKLNTDGLALTDQFHSPNVKLSAKEKLDSFRYFAKLLCCYLVEVGGPRSRSISAFALSETDKNPIFLNISRDVEYQAKLLAYDTNGFIEHGGLKFIFDNRMLVKSIESSLSAGGIKYVFKLHLSLALKLELHLKYGGLIRKARANLIENG